MALTAAEGNGATVQELLREIPIVDADTHISEWYDLWTSRATPKFRDRVPQIRKTNGKPEWVIDGQILNHYGANSSVRKDGSKVTGMGFMDVELPDAYPASHDDSPVNGFRTVIRGELSSCRACLLTSHPAG